MVISVPSVLSVFHFSVKVRPYSDLLYLVSRVPATLLVSVLEEPAVLNSCKGQRSGVNKCHEGRGWVLVMYECNGRLEESTTMPRPWCMEEEPK